MHGRVIALDQVARAAIVRTEREDLRVAAEPSWKVGQLLDTAHVPPQPYPAPGSEVMRMPRSRMQALRARAQALSAIRKFFAHRGFLEVETPLLVPSPGLEIHLDAVQAGDGYLITSPEYSMKRLLAAGFEKIYTVCKCFRANEHGAHHSSEFTMIEWYRGYDTINAIARDIEELVHTVCGELARIGDRSISVKPPWKRISVRAAMADWAGVQVDGGESADELAARVRAAGIECAPQLAWDDVFFTAWLARVDPALAALDHAIIVEDWPVPLAALARRKPNEPGTALRFEAYVGGIELANAFDELVDPAEQEARFLDEQKQRYDRGRPVYPIDHKLIAALREGVPPSGGIALGFDRLVMLATGSTDIAQVQAFSDAER